MKLLKNTIKLISAIARLIFWHAELLIPRNKDRWIFGAWFGDRYTDNSRAMYEYVLKNMPQIKPMWLTRRKEIFEKLKSEGKPVEYLSSIKGKFYALTSSVAFITVDRPEVNGYYLHGAKLIWLYHGMLMKYVMSDERRFVEGPSYDEETIRKKVIKFFFPYNNNYYVDKILVTSNFFSPFFASAFKVEKSRIWDFGYPRNDEFFSNSTESIVEMYKKKYPTAKFIIHMPTHRLHGLDGSPFNPFEGYNFNSTKFLDCLELGDYVYFYKGHFYDSKNNVDIKHDRFVRIKDEDFDNLYRLVKDMDILITDYSSIYFDYLLLNRPIILTPFDYDFYIGKERPLYYDYKSNIEGNTVENWDDLIRMLSDKTYTCPSNSLIEKYHKYRDGQSCKRIADNVLLDNLHK